MFKNLFSKKSSATETANDDDPTQLSIAALLVEAARADDHYTENEKKIIDRSLAKIFEISDADAKTLRAQAETAQADALDIQRFTRIAKEISEADKISFIEVLWEIILSDGDRDPYEDTLMRRICGLVYVDDRASGEARNRVAARLTGK